jgi:hypothetical protein
MDLCNLLLTMNTVFHVRKTKMKSRTYPDIKAKSDVLTFGVYKGWTVENMLELHPDYILWLANESVCKVNQEVYDLAAACEFDRRINQSLTGESVWDYMAD